MSFEVDLVPIADTNEKAAVLADLIEGVAGELSPSTNSTVSASTGSILRPPICPTAGATVW
jgi:hypothetical protein